MRLHHRLPLLLIGLLPAPAATAQARVPIVPAKGGGIAQSCDTSMHVDFSVAYLDGFACQVAPQVIPGSCQVLSARWDAYDPATEAWDTRYEPAPTITFQGPQPAPLCYSVFAFDLIASQPCTTAVCKLVAPFAHALCASLQADFTIEAVNGSAVTFTDLTQFPGDTVAHAAWSFGDGSAPDTVPVHTFPGNGPYEVCLTAWGGPASECVSTRCKWLYLGPGSLPCSDLVSQGFVLLQQDNLVGAIDTSLTSGMEARYDWDFGDGYAATGRIVAHTYSQSTAYQFCGTLRVWGPLLADTCVSTLCEVVYPSMPAIGVGEHPGARAPFAWPSPFTDAIRVAGASEARELRLLDGAGRQVRAWRMPPGAEAAEVPLPALAPGPYLLVAEGPSGRQAQLLVKEP